MKVSKTKFEKAVNYLKEINSCELSTLDLSEFTTKDLSFFMKDWNSTGMSNVDFLKMIL